MTRPGTGRYELLLERCKSLEPVPTAVAHPCEASALAGAVDAGQKGLIVPILVGAPTPTRYPLLRRQPGSIWTDWKIVDAPDSHAAAARAVQLIREGRR